MKKGIGTERKEAAITNQTGGGAGAERSSEATLFFFKLLYVSFDVLFPDSPDDLFFCEKLNGGKNQSNQSTILESKSQLDASCG